MTTNGTHGVTKEGVQGRRPGREATVGVNVGPGRPPAARSAHKAAHGRGEQPMVPEAEFASYYGKAIINRPVWEAPDIPGYLFLGGLAGASSVLAAGAQLTGRHALATTTKLGAAAAAGLSLVALVHDLGRRGRFLNMLRTFKVTSPMSVGSWLLSVYGPAAFVAAGTQLSGLFPGIGTAATAAAALVGPAVATYTAALIANTAVPAWHDAYKEMPFVFAASAMSAAGGLGLVGAPPEQAAPARRLAVVAGALELLGEEALQRRTGLAGEAYEEGKAHRYDQIAKVTTAAGVLGALLGRKSRALSALSGAALLVGSAFARFGIFEAGLISAEDPKYTVVPQRKRIAQRAREES